MNQQSLNTELSANPAEFVLLYRKLLMLRLGLVGGMCELRYTDAFKAQFRLLPIAGGKTTLSQHSIATWKFLRSCTVAPIAPTNVIAFYRTNFAKRSRD